jgi:hypothetical protein
VNIEIDQSGRIEVLTVDTAFGFSNRRQSAILVPVAVKRQVSGQLHARGVRPKLVSVRMFAASLFLLLEDHLAEIDLLTIDREFPGWEPVIKGFLLDHIRSRYGWFPTEAIAFGEIGKASRAHLVAWRTYRGERPAEKVITSSQLLKRC